MPALLTEELYFTLSFRILLKLIQCINTHSRISLNFLTWSLNRLKSLMMSTNEFKHFSQKLPRRFIWTFVEDCLIFINWFSHSASQPKFKDLVVRLITVSGIYSSEELLSTETLKIFLTLTRLYFQTKLGNTFLT